MVRALRPDEWPFATDEERAEGSQGEAMFQLKLKPSEDLREQAIFLRSRADNLDADADTEERKAREERAQAAELRALAEEYDAAATRIEEY